MRSRSRQHKRAALAHNTGSKWGWSIWLGTCPQISATRSDRTAPAAHVAGTGLFALQRFLTSATERCRLDPTDQHMQRINNSTKGNHTFVNRVDFKEVFQPITLTGFWSPKNIKQDKLHATQLFDAQVPTHHEPSQNTDPCRS